MDYLLKNWFSYGYNWVKQILWYLSKTLYKFYKRLNWKFVVWVLPVSTLYWQFRFLNIYIISAFVLIGHGLHWYWTKYRDGISSGLAVSWRVRTKKMVLLQCVSLWGRWKKSQVVLFLIFPLAQLFDLSPLLSILFLLLMMFVDIVNVSTSCMPKR